MIRFTFLWTNMDVENPPCLARFPMKQTTVVFQPWFFHIPRMRWLDSLCIIPRRSKHHLVFWKNAWSTMINWHDIFFYLLLDSLLVYIPIVYTICSNSWWSSSNRPSMFWCWRSPLWSQEYSHALHGMRQKKPNPLLLQSSSPCFVQTQDEHVYFIYIYIYIYV